MLASLFFKQKVLHAKPTISSPRGLTPGSSLASSYQTISSHVSVVAPSLQAGTMSDSAASGQESINYSAAPSVASERNTPFSGSDAGSWITLNTAHEHADALEDIFERMNALLIQ
jgi:hypothetical protein